MAERPKDVIGNIYRHWRQRPFNSVLYLMLTTKVIKVTSFVSLIKVTRTRPKTFDRIRTRYTEFKNVNNFSKLI